MYTLTYDKDNQIWGYVTRKGEVQIRINTTYWVTSEKGPFTDVAIFIGNEIQEFIYEVEILRQEELGEEQIRNFCNYIESIIEERRAFISLSALGDKAYELFKADINVYWRKMGSTREVRHYYVKKRSWWERIKYANGNKNEIPVLKYPGTRVDCIDD